MGRSEDALRTEPKIMKTRREFVFRASYGLAAAVLSPGSAYPGVKGDAEYDVRKFGAVGDGVTVDSASIQRAIDTASARGGGRVMLPGGRRFVTGALVLKSG